MISLDQIIYNPGFHAVAIEIFLNLDPESLGNCRVLSKVYKYFIDNTKPLMILTIKHANSNRELILQSVMANITKSQIANNKYEAACVAHAATQPSYVSLISKPPSKLFYNLCNEYLEKSDLKIVVDFMKTIWAKPDEISRVFIQNEMNIFKYVLGYRPEDIIRSKLFGDFAIIIFHLIIKSSDKMNIKLEHILISAIVNRNIALVRKILDHTIQTGNNFDFNNRDGYEALHCALISWKPDFVKLLFNYPSSKRIKLNSGVSNGQTSRSLLHIACSSGPIEIVDLLLQHIQKYEEDFDFNMPDSRGCTPMHNASSYNFGEDGGKANRLLMLHKEKKIYLNFNAQESETGKVFWFNFAFQPQRKWNVENLTIVLDLSRENDEDIDIDIADIRGWTVLHYASFCGGCVKMKKFVDSESVENIVTVKLLLDHYGMTNRINPYAQDQNGDTPLHLACFKRRPKVIQVFVDYGLVNDIKNNKGLTPVEIASKYGFQEIVQLLNKKH